jgi:hypothetical protein
MLAGEVIGALQERGPAAGVAGDELSDSAGPRGIPDAECGADVGVGV